MQYKNICASLFRAIAVLVVIVWSTAIPLPANTAEDDPFFYLTAPERFLDVEPSSKDDVKRWRAAEARKPITYLVATIVRICVHKGFSCKSDLPRLEVVVRIEEILKHKKRGAVSAEQYGFRPDAEVTFWFLDPKPIAADPKLYVALAGARRVWGFRSIPTGDKTYQIDGLVQPFPDQKFNDADLRDLKAKLEKDYSSF